MAAVGRTEPGGAGRQGNDHDRHQGVRQGCRDQTAGPTEQTGSSRPLTIPHTATMNAAQFEAGFSPFRRCQSLCCRPAPLTAFRNMCNPFFI